MFRHFFIAVLFLMHAPFVHAATIGVDGFDPLITLGFNPQPEPPPEFNFTISQTVNPFDIVARVSGVEPQPFATGPFSGVEPQPFLLALEVSGGKLFPPDPIVPVNNMFDVALRTGGETLTLSFTLFFPDGSPLRTVVNSQETGSLLLSLDLIDAKGGTQPDEIAVRMQVLSEGDALGLSAVPLPPTLLLFGAALLGLGALRRRI